MRADVAKDFEWGRLFLADLKAISGRYLFSEAPPVEDMKHNTDLIVLTVGDVRLACRVRREKGLDGQDNTRYRGQFTIRSGRPSGAKTEMRKLLEGWGSHILYGFGIQTTAGAYLTSWALGDLDLFRQWWREEYDKKGSDPKKLPGVTKPNRDGSSKFCAFRFSEMPDGFLIASHNLP